MTWYQCTDGAYVNTATCRLVPVQVSSSWRIGVQNGGASSTVDPNVYLNAGPYSTSSDAVEAIRKLVSGVDPSTIV